MRLALRFAAATLLVVSLPAAQAQQQPELILETVWEAELPSGSLSWLSACVSPTGRLHVIDGDGSWTVFASTGRVLTRRTLPAVNAPIPMACGTDETVYLAMGNKLATFSSRLELLETRDLWAGVVEMTGGESGSLYLQTVGGPGWLLRIHPTLGDTIRTAARWPRTPMPEVYRTSFGITSLVVDESAGLIFYKHDAPYLFDVFDLTGRLLRRAARTVPGELRPLQQGHLTAPDPLDRTQRMFRLGNLLVVDVAEGSFGEHYLELLDTDLNLVAPPVPKSGFGSLLAAGPDGSLFGLRTVGGTRVLTKARLVPAPRPD